MASPNHVDRSQTGANRRSGTVFGVPVANLGWFQVILMGLASGFVAFFLATFASIVVLLLKTAITHEPVDFALTYKRIGLPIGLVVGSTALGVLGYHWVRRILTKGRGE